jgi:hypothetical protein
LEIVLREFARLGFRATARRTGTSKQAQMRALIEEETRRRLEGTSA